MSGSFELGTPTNISLEILQKQDESPSCGGVLEEQQNAEWRGIKVLLSKF
jgi:hypothetical protein